MVLTTKSYTGVCAMPPIAGITHEYSIELTVGWVELGQLFGGLGLGLGR